MTTVTVATADLGGFPAGQKAHPLVIERAAQVLRKEHGGLIIDSFVTRVGGRLACIFTHRDDPRIADLLTRVMEECRTLAGSLGLTGSGEAGRADLPVETGDGVLVFLSSGAAEGAWSEALARIFADPYTTPALVDDPLLRRGFTFTCTDGGFYPTPSGIYDLLAHIDDGASVVKVEGPETTVAAACTGADPALLLGTGRGCPPVAGVLAAVADSDFMPVSLCDAVPVCTKAVCLGFGIHDGMLIGPADLFDDPAFTRR
ncbi:MAG: fructose 1,6-bisphosphatase [Methanofollis sp.]|uniref:fructose 1,6-bisphosphatase n=1 Tax=Methanofollis sp. TaxID=2052835 RepID=UPI0026269255|nr:fructose 1,6-bisphosphatase [Methanofollis sp.]MDD4254120.1 fructose 1,6-bisphosphatase [Methanofollis sp.]